MRWGTPQLGFPGARRQGEGQSGGTKQSRNRWCQRPFRGPRDPRRKAFWEKALDGIELALLQRAASPFAVLAPLFGAGRLRRALDLRAKG